MVHTLKQRRKIKVRVKENTPEFLSEYVASLPKVRQVIGEKSMAHTVGAVATYVERIKTKIQRSEIGVMGDDLLDPSMGDKIIIGSTQRLVATLSLISGATHKLAERSLSTKLDRLNKLDSRLIEKAYEKGYFSATLPVFNRLTGDPTSLITEINGEQRVNIRNSYSSHIADFNEEPGKQHPAMKNDWVRALVLFHEMAHAEFVKMDRNFQPTPGLLLKNPDKEQKALDAINTWATHAAIQDHRPNLAYDVLNESHSDAFAALMIIKESGNDPQARAAVESMYVMRENKRVEVQGRSFIGTGYQYNGCPYALEEVLSMGDSVLDMDVEQIREKALEVASNSLLIAAREDPRRQADYLEGLTPSNSLSPLYLILKRAARGELGENIETHPLSTVAKYDLRWLENKYGPIYTNPESIGTEKALKVNPKLISALSSDFLSWTEEDLKVATPPRGVSRDVYKGRMNVFSKIHEQWKQDVQIASCAVSEYKENVENEACLAAGHQLNPLDKMTSSPP